MRDKTKRTFVAVVSNLLMIAILLAGVVYADVVTIDTFNSGNQELVVHLTDDHQASSVGTVAGDILGAYRDAEVNFIDTGHVDGPKVTLAIDAGSGVGTNYLSFSADSNAQGEAKITWDGDNDPDVLDSEGLDANLASSDPTNEGLLLRVLNADRTATLKFTAYMSDTVYSNLSFTINERDQDIDWLDLFFPFNLFTPVSGSGVDWEHVGALVLDISGDEDLDLTIDYIEARTEPRDYGDLPDSSFSGVPDYTDVLDAYHVPKGLTLGEDLDTEDSYQPSSTAFGDDAGGFDDEDGVNPRYVFDGFYKVYVWQANVKVNGCAGTCYLYGWVDWDHDGTFSNETERAIEMAGSSEALSASYTLSPASTVQPGYYYLRFRVCDVSTECDDPGTGNNDTRATNGEVEDYRWYMDPTAAELSSFTAAWQDRDVVVDWESASEVGLAGFNVWRSTDPTDHGEQLNAVVIPPQTPGELTGNAYSYTDLTAVPGTIYYYWLEARQVGASSYWHGPMQPTGSFRVYLPVLLRGH